MRSVKILMFAVGLGACGRISPPPERGGLGREAAEQGSVDREVRAPTPRASAKAEVLDPSPAPIVSSKEDSLAPATSVESGLSPEAREESNWVMAESVYRFEPGCSDPWVVFALPSDGARRDGAFVAAALAEFPRLDADFRRDGELRRVAAVPGGAYDLAYYRRGRWGLARCESGRDCARLAWVLAVATAMRPAVGCGSAEGWTIGDAVGLPSASTVSLPAGDVCARVRLCAAKVTGQVWECSAFERDDLVRCGRSGSCAEVQACIDALDWSNSDRPRPAPLARPPGI